MSSPKAQREVPFPGADPARSETRNLASPVEGPTVKDLQRAQGLEAQLHAELRKALPDKEKTVSLALQSIELRGKLGTALAHNLVGEDCHGRDKDAAKAHYAKAAKAFDADSDRASAAKGLVNLAYCAHEDNDHPAFKRHEEAAREKDVQRVHIGELDALCGTHALERGDFEAARTYLQRTIDREPEKTFAWAAARLAYGRSYERQGNLAEAKASFQGVLNGDKENKSTCAFYAHTHLGLIAGREARPEVAREQLSRARDHLDAYLKAWPDDPYGHHYKAIIETAAATTPDASLKWVAAALARDSSPGIVADMKHQYSTMHEGLPGRGAALALIEAAQTREAAPAKSDVGAKTV